MRRRSHLGNLLSQHGHLLRVAGIVGQREENLITCLGLCVSKVELAITSDAPCKVHILLLNSDALSMDRTEVCILEQTNDVGLGSLL